MASLDDIRPRSCRSIGQAHRLGRAASAVISRVSCRLLVVLIYIALCAVPAHAVDSVSICYGSVPSALLPLAKTQGYDSAQGLDFDLRPFPSGRQAVDAMFAGQCAMATAADIPVVHGSLYRNDFRIVASISTYNNLEGIVARRDRGISTPQDLRGRRIAVAEFTGAHYFLDIFLISHGLMPTDVRPTYLPAQEVIAAFRRGDVDAAVHWQPNVQTMAAHFGGQATVFASPGLHTSPFLLVAREEYLQHHPAMVQGILRALVDAERYVQAQPSSAKELAARSYTIGPAEMDLTWPLHTFRVSLGQSLLLMLENAARWEIALQEPARRPDMPNYLRLIYFDGLLAVRPDAVTIIR